MSLVILAGARNKRMRGRRPTGAWRRAPAAAVLAAVLALPPVGGVRAAPRPRPPLGSTPTPAQAPMPAQTAYEAAFRDFVSLRADSGRVASVRGVVLRRDVGILRLDRGDLALCKPAGGRVWGAVFSGSGSFSFRPPTQLERDQLRRFYKTDSLHVPFDGLVLLFADSTERELETLASFERRRPPQRSPRLIRDCLDLFIDKDKLDFTEGALAKTLLEGELNGAFVAYVSPAKGGRKVCFGINPYLTEQVVLWRPVKRYVLQNRIRDREIISQFQLGGDSTSEREERSDLRPSYDEQEIRVDTRLDGGLHFSAESVTRLRSLREGQRWISLALAPKLEVDSVLWEDGRSADYYKEKDASWLWIRCDSALAMDEVRTIRVRYHGDIVERRGDWVYFDPRVAWYPRHSVTRTRFDLTYHYPDTYRLASVGDPVSQETKDGMVVSRWVMADPILQASFMVGVYDAYKLDAPNIPPVTILFAEAAHQSDRSESDPTVAPPGYVPGRSKGKQVGEDVANSLLFFQNTYGPTPLKQFYAAENPMPQGVLGLAFPGLIHLGAETFYNLVPEGSEEVRAHEVAHQWWGALGVTPATYHDVWLSEAFAEFSALCYVQAATKSNARYFDALEKSRQRILHDRKFVLGSGQEAGPIWLGTRNATSSTERDYTIVVYDKGAWVLEMLRNLFLNLDTMQDDGFGALMRDFYATYANQDATTEDFRRVVEKQAGRDMSWFFDEWVYGTGILHYRFAYRVTRAADGKFRIACRVDQENVPADFQMFVPIHIDFGGERYSKVRVFVKGRHSEFDLPLVAEKPERVVFNDLESVLCEVQNVKW